jgi:hypothetical protein
VAAEPESSDLGASLLDGFLSGDPLPGSPEWSRRSPAPVSERDIVLTPASAIKPRPVHWLDEGRIPVGGLTLLAGREGIGKSTYAYTLAADVTRGKLPGLHFGKPRSVIVAATEDSWDRTIVPRLMAAGADLDLVYRSEVACEGYDSALSLPTDLAGLEYLIGQKDTALILLDPLLSRLAGQLDTHKDAEVRRALEPLAAMADRSGAAVIGLIHVSKASTTDPLTSIMGSRAFAAVARAVIYMAADPDDAELRLVGSPKNAWGKMDTTTRTCRIEGVKVVDTDEGEVWTGKLIWEGERAQSIRDLLEAQLETAESRSATGEARAWLSDYLESRGGSALRKEILAAGQLDGHSAPSLRRAREQLNLRDENVPGAFPRQTVWRLREIKSPSRDTDPPSHTTSTTSTTAHTHSRQAINSPSGASGDSGVKPPRARTHTREEAVADVQPQPMPAGLGPAAHAAPDPPALAAPASSLSRDWHAAGRDGHSRRDVGASKLRWPAELTRHGSEA